MTERFPLFNLLVKTSEWVLVLSQMLLIKGRHAKLLMDERLMLATRRSVAIVRIVAEVWIVQVAECLWHDCIDST